VQGLRPHVVDARPDADRTVGRGRRHEIFDDPPVARIGKIQRAPVPQKLEIGRVAAVVTGRAGSLPASPRLAAGGDNNGIDCGGYRRLIQDVFKFRSNWQVTDLALDAD